MLSRCVGTRSAVSAFLGGRGRRVRRLALGFLIISATPATSSFAQTALPPVTVGGGLQTSFFHTEPNPGISTDEFLVNSVRLYVNGSATEDIKFMFNTEYEGGTNEIGVLDAVARFEPDPMFNIWAGRFLPPSDRANLYGPYYSHHWATFTDGVQDGYPFISAGRSNGVAYWGDFADGRLKLSGGAFDGASATGNSDVIGAGRVQYDFWDTEPGYYLNGNYYGDKDLLALGGAFQVQSGNVATTADFLLEKQFDNEGVVSVESQYSYYDALGGYDGNYRLSRGAYILGAYMFPQQVGIGKFEILGKYAFADFTRGITLADIDYDQKTTEFNFSYIMRAHNARLMFVFLDTDFSGVKTDFWRAGAGIQIQM